MIKLLTKPINLTVWEKVVSYNHFSNDEEPNLGNGLISFNKQKIYKEGEGLLEILTYTPEWDHNTIMGISKHFKKSSKGHVLGLITKTRRRPRYTSPGMRCSFKMVNGKPQTVCERQNPRVD